MPDTAEGSLLDRATFVKHLQECPACSKRTFAMCDTGRQLMKDLGPDVTMACRLSLATALLEGYLDEIGEEWLNDFTPKRKVLLGVTGWLLDEIDGSRTPTEDRDPGDEGKG